MKVIGEIVKILTVQVCVVITKQILQPDQRYCIPATVLSKSNQQSLHRDEFSSRTVLLTYRSENYSHTSFFLTEEIGMGTNPSTCC